jgi:glycosyltransferase involved in cell wall biosynthesis
MTEPRRILFFVEGEPHHGLSPASRLRAYQYAPLFAEAGIECLYLPSHPPKYFHNRYSMKLLRPRARWLYRLILLCGWGVMCVNRLLQILRVRPTDIVVLQREFLPNSLVFLETTLARKTERLIFDVDDAIFEPFTDGNPRRSEEQQQKVQTILKLAHTAVVSTPYLQTCLRPFHSRIHVISTPVDTDAIRPIQHARSSSPPVIGWIGSSSNLIFLKPLEDVFRQLAQTHQFRFRIICNRAHATEYPDLSADWLEIIEWSLDTESEELQKLDVGIMPLCHNRWCLGKAGFKLLQYMAAGLPIVASPVGFNCELVQHGVNGFLADSDNEWEEFLARLLQDRELRQRMGQEGRQFVEKEFSLRPTFAKLLNVINSP